jgi:hypothetical protein
MSVATKKCTISAGRMAPVVWLRNGRRRRRDLTVCSGRLVLRRLHLRCAVGLAFDLQDDSSLDQSIQEGHRQRTVGQILPPFIEIHISDQCRRALLISRSDDLIEQMGGLGAFCALDSVKPEFIDKCLAEHLSINVKFPEMWS